MKMSRRKNNRSTSGAKLYLESLEARRLLAADFVVFQNPILPHDVNLDEHISPADALAIINELNIPTANPLNVGTFLDTTGDDVLTPIDALNIINEINEPSVDDELASLMLTRDYLFQEFDQIPETAEPVATKFNSLLTNYESTSDSIYASLRSFREYSLDNLVELTEYYSKLEQATLMNRDTLNRGLASIAGEVKTVSVHSFGNVPDQPGSDFDTPYEFDPTEYDDPALALPELFEELEQGLDQVEVPTYGDVLDNYDEIYQTYEDSNNEIDVFVTESLDVSQYEEFVLHGGNVGDLLETLEQGTDAGITTVNEVLDLEYGTELELGSFFDDFLDTAYIGELIYNDMVAIGGETTGSVVLLGDQSILEVDFGNSESLHELAEIYDNQVVILEGASTIVAGVEMPDRTVIQVRTIFGTGEMESLESTLNTLDPLDSHALLPILNNLNLG